MAPADYMTSTHLSGRLPSHREERFSAKCEAQRGGLRAASKEARTRLSESVDRHAALSEVSPWKVEVLKEAGGSCPRLLEIHSPLSARLPCALQLRAWRRGG